MNSCRKITAVNIAINAGSENIIKATNPPRKDEVAYIDIAVKSWVDVGPGNDWHIVSN